MARINWNYLNKKFDRERKQIDENDSTVKYQFIQ